MTFRKKEEEHELMAGLISGFGLYPTDDEILDHLKATDSLDFFNKAKEWLVQLKKEADEDKTLSKFDKISQGPYRPEKHDPELIPFIDKAREIRDSVYMDLENSMWSEHKKYSDEWYEEFLGGLHDTVGDGLSDEFGKRWYSLPEDKRKAVLATVKL